MKRHLVSYPAFGFALLLLWSAHLCFLRKIVLLVPADTTSVLYSALGISLQLVVWLSALILLARACVENVAQASALWLGGYVWADLLLFNWKGMHFSSLLQIAWQDGPGHLFEIVTFTGLGAGAILGIGAVAVLSVPVAWSLAALLKRTFPRAVLAVGPWGVGGLLVAALLGAYAEQSLGTQVKTSAFFEKERRAYPLYVKLVRQHPSNVFYKVTLDREWERPLAFAPKRKSLRGASPPVQAFLFVLESVRGDFIDERTAPTLDSLRREHLYATAFSSASNGTAHSWFALFHSRLPFYLPSYIAEPAPQGATALRWLRELGMNIFLFSASDIRFNQSDALLFGPKLALVDRAYLHYDKPAAKADAATISDLEKHLETLDRSRDNIHLVFLESAHYPYVWPESMEVVFNPVAGRVNFARLPYDPNEIEALRNRYRQSLSYVDSQMGRVVQRLKKLGLWEAATVVVVGDHGEEFFEKGEFTHAGHIVREQFDAYFAMKIPGRTPGVVAKPMSHIDIFPSLLPEWNIEYDTSAFDGVSVFYSDRTHQLISANSGSIRPDHFALVSQDSQLHFETRTKKGSDTLLLTRVTDLQDAWVEDMALSVEQRALAWHEQFSRALKAVPFISSLDGPFIGWKRERPVQTAP